MARSPKRHRCLLPVAVPLLLAFCFACIPFFQRPTVVSAQDRAVVTRIREYFPQDDLTPDIEFYYPQISFGGNPNQLQTANAMMREYAIRQYHLYRQTAKAGRLAASFGSQTPVVLTDYEIRRNSGGYFSVQFRSINASLANSGCFTVRLADQKVCRLADLFLSDTDYCSLLNQEISRQLQKSFEDVRYDTAFCLTDESILLLFPQEEQKETETFEVSLSQPAVARKLAPWLGPGHTGTAPPAVSSPETSQEQESSGE